MRELLDLDDDLTDDDEHDEITDHCGVCGYMKALISINRVTNAMTCFCPDCGDYLEYVP